MIRIVGLLVIRQVTRLTRGVGQVVGGSAMTLAALQAAVRPSQRPSRARMIKDRGRPVGSRVAQLARLRETRSHVIRAVRGSVFRAVASVTVGRDRCVVVVLMAVGAGHRRMLPRQREARIVVVEDRGRPGGGAVTHLALLRKIHRGMIRIVRALIILLMAGVAGCCRQVVVPALVAIPTLHLRMCPGERKRRLGMVK